MLLACWQMYCIYKNGGEDDGDDGGGGGVFLDVNTRMDIKAN